MANGLLDIQSLFPEEANKSLAQRQQDAMLRATQLAAMRPRFAIGTGLLDASREKHFNRARQSLAGPFGRGMLTGEQNLQRSMADYARTGDEAALERSLSQHNPEALPGLQRLREQRRLQERQEKREDIEDTIKMGNFVINQKRFGLDKDRTEAAIADIEFKQERANVAEEQAWERLGLSGQQVALAKQQSARADEAARREAMQFVYQTEDRGGLAQSRERLGKLLDDRGMTELAEAARAPGSNLTSVINAMVALDSAGMRLRAAEAGAIAGELPKEGDIDSWVAAALVDAEKNGLFKRGTKRKDEEIQLMLRTFYINAGHAINKIDPVAAKRMAYEWIEENSEFFEKPSVEAGTKEVETQTAEDQELMGTIPTANVGNFYGRQPIA